MVQFTEKSIIVTIDCENFNPVEVLTDIKKSMLDMSFLAMSNKEFRICDVEPFWFTEVLKAFCEYEGDTYVKIRDAISE